MCEQIDALEKDGKVKERQLSELSTELAQQRASAHAREQELSNNLAQAQKLLRASQVH